MTLSFQAHAQFCQSGDNTLEGIRAACHHLAKYNDDDDDDDNTSEKYVLALSDANLERYNIHPSYASVLKNLGILFFEKPWYYFSKNIEHNVKLSLMFKIISN